MTTRIQKEKLVKNMLMIAQFLFALTVIVGISNFNSKGLFAHGTDVGTLSVFPGKVEVSLEPGEKIIVELKIENTLGETRQFEVSVEDFIGSADPGLTVDLLGEKAGPYSLKDFISVPQEKFTIADDQYVNIPVTISLPETVSPGGLYASVLVGTVSEPSAGSGSAVVSRVGALFFVKIPGNIFEEGELIKFSIDSEQKVFEKTPINFDLQYENTGTVYLNPYGEIRIKNIFGKYVGAMRLDPWFVLPNSVRTREISWNESLKPGRYTASAYVNRGYEDIVDTNSVSFWIIPKNIILPITVATVIAIIVIAGIIFKKFLGGNRDKTKTISILLVIILTIAMSAAINSKSIFAQMSSTNYKMQKDSVNFGGGLSESTNYDLESTAGEIATGDSQSSNYKIRAGYQQMDLVSISISGASAVTMSPSLPSSGSGTGNGSTAVTVTTDSASGYELSIKASSTPAMQGNTTASTIANYTPSGASPDFTFALDSTADGEFGFTPEGTDITSEYKDNGTACNIGAGSTSDACWNPVTTTSEVIAQKTSANYSAGTETTVKFRIGFGATHTQTVDTYVATTTLTALSI